MALIFTADCHFRDGIFSRLPEVDGDTQNAINQLLLICVDERLQSGSCSLIFGGDIFDVKTPAPHIVLMVQQLVLALDKKGIKSYYITGNHDAAQVFGKSWGDIIGANPLHGRITIIDGMNIYGLNNLRRPELLQALQGVPHKTDVLILHQAIKDGLSFVTSTGGISWNFEKEDCPEHIRVVLMGDLHITEAYENKTTLFAYPGSLVAKEITERPDKYVIKLDNQYNLSYVPIETRDIVHEIIDTEEELIVLYNAYSTGVITERELKSVCIIKYNADIKSAPIYIDKIKEFGITHIIPIAVFKSSAVEGEVLGPKSVAGLKLSDFVDTFIDPEKEREAFDFATSFIDAPNKAAYLKEQRKKIIEGTTGNDKVKKVKTKQVLPTS